MNSEILSAYRTQPGNSAVAGFSPYTNASPFIAQTAKFTTGRTKKKCNVCCSQSGSLSCLNVPVFISQVRTNRMPELLEVILETTRKVYCQAHIC
jgi:hypothetical protein